MKTAVAAALVAATIVSILATLIGIMFLAAVFLGGDAAITVIVVVIAFVIVWAFAAMAIEDAGSAEQIIAKYKRGACRLFRIGTRDLTRRGQ